MEAPPKIDWTKVFGYPAMRPSVKTEQLLGASQSIMDHASKPVPLNALPIRRPQ